jgi:hypothetical protein
MRNEPTCGLPLPDAEIQIGVLRHLLDLHPARLTGEELLRELASDPDDFAERDCLERAVGALIGVGLLQRDGRFVLPTRSAVAFQALSPA